MNLPTHWTELIAVALSNPSAVEKSPAHKYFFDEADTLCTKLKITRQQLAAVLNNISAAKGLLAWHNIDAYLIVLAKSE